MFILFLLLCFIAIGIVEGVLGLTTTEHWAQRGQWWFDTGYRTRGGPLTSFSGWRCSFHGLPSPCVGCTIRGAAAFGC